MRIKYLIITGVLLVLVTWALPGYRHGVLDAEFLVAGQSSVSAGSGSRINSNPPNPPSALPEVPSAGNRNAPAAVPPCTGSVEVDTESPTSLDSLVRAAPLIIVGTVIEVFPPAYAEPSGRSSSIHTQSLISVDQLIKGSLTAGTNRIGFAQLGGKIAPADQSVAGDPIVQRGERYLLFLQPDNRAIPANASGAPRFTAVGVWTGKVKIANGKIQFSCASGAQFKKYDNTDVDIFVNAVKSMIANGNLF